MPVSRRRFLASAAALGLAPLAACGDQVVRASSCEGYAALDARDLQQRQALGYLDVTPDLAQQCAGCAYYQASVVPPCGGCQLFAGPVSPAGYCASWASSA